MDNTLRKENGKNNGEKNKFLSFFSNDVEYAVDIKYVTDIIKNLPVTFIPKLPKYIRGVINLRGKIIPIIDMRLKLGLQEVEYTESACIIVVEYQNYNAGILVDSVAEVSDVKISEIMSPPRQNSSEHNRFVCGISNQKGKVKLIVNCLQLLDVV